MLNCDYVVTTKLKCIELILGNRAAVRAMNDFAFSHCKDKKAANATNQFYLHSLVLIYPRHSVFST